METLGSASFPPRWRELGQSGKWLAGRHTRWSLVQTAGKSGPLGMGNLDDLDMVTHPDRHYLRCGHGQSQRTCVDHVMVM